MLTLLLNSTLTCFGGRYQWHGPKNSDVSSQNFPILQNVDSFKYISIVICRTWKQNETQLNFEFRNYDKSSLNNDKTTDLNIGNFTICSHYKSIAKLYWVFYRVFARKAKLLFKITKQLRTLGLQHPTLYPFWAMRRTFWLDKITSTGKRVKFF